MKEQKPFLKKEKLTSLVSKSQNLNPFKKLAGQTAIYGLPTIVGRLLNYLLVPLYTYKFTPQEFGVNTELYSYVSFFMILLTYGMETAFFRFASENSENREKVFATSFLSVVTSSSVFLVVLLFLSTSIATWLGYPQHSEFISWFAWILVLDAITAISFAKLRSENRAGKFAFLKSINIFINILFNLFFIVYCADVYKKNPDSSITAFYDPGIGVGYIFLSNLIASAITFILLLPEAFRMKLKFDSQLWRSMILYALPLLVAGLAGMVNETLDRILLRYLLPYDNVSLKLHDIGVYGACYKVAILMTIFIQTYRYAAEPFFFSHAKSEDNKATYVKLMNYFVFFCSLIFLGTVLYIDIIKYFIGAAYREGLHIVPILLMANLFLGIFFNLSIWYKLGNQTMKGAWLAIIGAAITITLNFLLIPVMGYTGAAWTTLICYFSMTVISWIWGNKHYPVDYDLKRIILYLFISLLLYGLSVLIPTTDQLLRIGLNTLFLLLFIMTGYRLEFRSTRKT